MYVAILILLLIGLVYGPQLWARWVLSRYDAQQEHFPGSGGELARHLLDKFGMAVIKVEITDSGDHYDPVAKVVRLEKSHHDGKSLTAIAVAAHEVGHALQDHMNYAPLGLRTRLVMIAQHTDRVGAAVMLAIPIVAAITRVPSSGVIMALAGLLTLSFAALVHLVTLPVEWDASFGRALPMLKTGDYISAHEERAVRHILKACALTYLASSLAGLLNLWRWLAILRPVVLRR